MSFGKRFLQASFSLIIVGLITLGFGSSATAQMTQQAIDDLKADYESKIEVFRVTIQDIRQVAIAYGNAERSEAADLQVQWKQLKAQGNRQRDGLAEVAMELYPHWHDKHLSAIVQRIMQQKMDDGRVQEVLQIGKMILKKEPKNVDVHLLAARAAIQCNDFAFAANFASSYPTKLNAQDQEDIFLFEGLVDLQTRYKRELEFQSAEAEADDLPRVTMKTNKGDMVIELFENEAPSTVANFIWLVENGHFNGKIFHRVIQDFMAQGGLFDHQTGQPTGVNYMIYDECGVENARHHFYGSVSMAKQPAPNTGSSQFFMCLSPVPNLDGKHTVFGRIIKGLDILESITYTTQDSEEPIEGAIADYIITATVDRKRPDSKYEINKVPQ